MRVLCRHGHFAFYPQVSGDISMFASFYGIDLVSESDFYTFPALQGAPTYSIKGADYLGVTAIKTYSGQVWEVMRENGLVFNFSTMAVSLASEISILVSPILTGYYFLSETPFFQPGSIQKESGQKILSFDGQFLNGFKQLRLSEFGYE